MISTYQTMLTNKNRGSFADNIGLSFAAFAFASFEASKADERGQTYNPELCHAATQWQQENGRDSATAPQLPSNAAEFQPETH